MSKAPKFTPGEWAGDSKRDPSPPWQQTHAMTLSGRAFVDEADLLAVEMETKWGVGRLRLIVGPELRERFDRQRYLFNRALWHGTLEDVRLQSQRMIAGWRALDAKATQEGHQRPNPETWEVVLQDGSVAVLCRSELDAGAILKDGRHVRVYSLAEVARLLSGFPALATAKEIFPGAMVTDIRHAPDDPLLNVHDTSGDLNDPIPY